jgi:hypothetical protein
VPVKCSDGSLPDQNWKARRRVALDACCHELRDGCGLPTSPGLPVQVQSMRAADADWSESFSHALEAYRSAACDGLDASLAALALPPESVSKPVPAG